VARRASLHRTEVGKLEHGERTCRIDTLIRLAGAMVVPPGELLDGIDWVPGPESDGSFSFASGALAPMSMDRAAGQVVGYARAGAWKRLLVCFPLLASRADGGYP
jgi:hypothetical protein